MNAGDDQLEVTARVAEIAAAGLPLEPGLRALAEEAPSRRTRRALLSVCRRLEHGEPIDAVVARPDSGLPLHVAGLLAAGLRTGRLADVLSRYLDHARRWQDLRRQAVAALLYPAVLLLAAGGIVWFCLTWIVPEMKLMFLDFDIELPFGTIVLIEISDLLVAHGLWLLLGLGGLLFGVPALLVALGGAAVWRRALSLVPLIGPMIRYAALGEFCHLLAQLVGHDVLLPDALRMAAAGTPDADVAASIDHLARFSDAGGRLEDADFGKLRLPILLRGSLRWEGRGDALPNSLEATGEVFASLAAVRASLLRIIAGPIVIVAAGIVVAGLVLSQVAPLLKLMNDLS